MTTYYERNKEKFAQRYQANRDKVLDDYYVRKGQSPWSIMCTEAKRRARKHGWEFDITPDDIKAVWKDTCPVLGLRMMHQRGGGVNNDHSPSLDRIDSKKGYVKGNIAVISRRANQIKSNGDALEHYMVAEWMERELGSRTEPSSDLSTQDESGQG